MRSMRSEAAPPPEAALGIDWEVCVCVPKMDASYGARGVKVRVATDWKVMRLFSGVRQ